MDKDTEIPGQTRRSLPKTRTGCLTCKIRRLKCGEEKPHCHRCLTFGVKCEGYRSKYTRGWPQASHLKSRPLYSKDDLVATPTSMFRSPFADGEYQYFDRFCRQTSLEIFPSFDIGMTRQILLQACYTNAAIRHCIIAIGALDKTSSTTRDFGKKSLDSLDWMKNASKHHTIALKQYAKAVGIMTAAALTSRFDLRETLLTSLLVLCFEAWNGNLQLAIQQINVCIKLILQWKYSHGSIQNSGLSPQPNVVESELLQMFGRLAIQVAIFSPLDSIAGSEALVLLGTEGRSLVSSMPDSFADLKEAEIYNQGLLRQGTVFIQSNPPEKFVNVARSEIDPAILAEQENITSNALKWRRNFEKLKNDAAPGVRTRVGKAMEMEMQWAIGYVCTATCLSADETIYDPYTNYYSQVVDLAGEVLNDACLPDNLQATKYSFDNRIVIPVWMAGIWCRDQSVRRRAINVLLKFPRREGVWDSVGAARMVQWISNLEQKYSENGYIPGWARTHGFKWTADLEKRSAYLVCYQKACPYTNAVEHRKTVHW
ncbi:hypothetical protein VTL71DRAFT_1344 [Oculimacula yallundae]|uniref:Zn(2)-C6 fungal-type domain-containing protein n=1 Tax=Oculimacula yallundae TaxID=86028 RepID=A0ABR4CAG3_9HELO